MTVPAVTIVYIVAFMGLIAIGVPIVGGRLLGQDLEREAGSMVGFGSEDQGSGSRG